MVRHWIGALAVLGMMLGASTAGFAAETIRVGICVSWPGYSMYEVVKQKKLAPGYEIEQTIFEGPDRRSFRFGGGPDRHLSVHRRLHTADR